MAFTVKIRSKNYASFESLCEAGLEAIKEWFCSVHCRPNEKVYYRTTREVGIRTYFVERVNVGKLVLKVRIQSTDMKQSKNTGTFEVLSSYDEIHKILNDSLETFRVNGKPLEAAGYYRKLSEYFDIGRDRLIYVLKWINETIEVDRTVSNTYDVNGDHHPCKELNNDNVDQENHTDDDNDENDCDKTSEEDSCADDFNQNARKFTVAEESTLSQIPVSILKAKCTQFPRKRANSESMDRSPLSQPKRLNRTLENLTIWNNKAAAFKTMPPLDRKQRRVGLQRNQ
ncbi:unnamed protein product [Rotaria socialis]